MRWPVPASFRSQIAIIGLACAAVAGLAALLIRDVITTTEEKLLAEARQQCLAACQELKLQYQERGVYGDEALRDLPLEAQDVSLRGLTHTVLRAYDAIEGGFLLSRAGKIIGYAAASHTGNSNQGLTQPVQKLIAGAGAEIPENGGTVVRSAQWDREFAVVAIADLGRDDARVWTLKRLQGVRDPVVERRRWLLAALVASTLLGVGGIVSTWYVLHSGVTGINKGLRRLEEDFTFRLPSIRGDLGQVVNSINRMTERRVALEAELRRQDRLAALGKVVAGVAHEVRNPLNSMKLTLELLERRIRRGAAASDEVQAAIREIDRLDLIVSRLLAFGRPVLQDRHVQNIAPLMRRAVDVVQDQGRRKNISIAVHIPEDSALSLDVDGPQIEQVLINLLLNAIDASEPSGQVELRCERRDDQAWITVRDQGPGIPEEARVHVFDAYFTTKPDGSGLGLSISREIIANHGGLLEFESKSGSTVFRIILPAERSLAREA